MPELPEVELTRLNLKRWLSRDPVVRAEAEEVRTFRGARPGAFEALEGRLVSADRRGKYLLLAFDSGAGLIAHLGMTGKFVRRPKGVDEPYSRARLVLKSGRVIHFRDPRMFGRLEPTDAQRLWSNPVIQALGFDPWVDGICAEQLREALGSSKQALKVALMDQARVAGLGNIHAAEALYRARLDPRRKPASLSASEWRRLAEGVRQTISFALENEEGEELEYVEEPGAENPFLVYGRAGENCRRCGSRIKALAQGGLTTHYCPGCQPLRGAR